MSNKKRQVEVVAYNPNWPKMFEAEAAEIRRSLGLNCIHVHHIGSTSVVGLGAKPVIDILPVVQDILLVDTDQVKEDMERLGYTVKGENQIPFRRFFCKPTVNVHVFESSSPEVEHHLAFRDYLSSNPDVCDKYLELKQELAQIHANHVGLYSYGKSDFISNVLEKTEFSGIFMRNCITKLDWEAFQSILGARNSFYSSQNPETHKVNDDENFNFVLYSGPRNFIAAAHIKLKEQARIQAWAFTEMGNSKTRQDFLKLLQLWANHRGFEELFMPNVE